MRLRRALLALALFAAAPVHAGEAPNLLAFYASNNGSLPPPHHWSYRVEFFVDGSASITYCKGYTDAPPGCALVAFEISDEDLAMIKDTIAAGGFESAPKAIEDPPVGGGSSYGGVIIAGSDEMVVLPAFPVKADEARIFKVFAVLSKLTPQDALRKASDQAQDVSE